MPPTVSARTRLPDSKIFSGAELKQAGFRNSDLPPAQVDPFHILHKVPVGDSPYVRAKHIQLVDKEPSKSISLFWSAINTGDRIDSALKDMAIVMKQLNRAEEAVEAIKSFRHLCSYQAQESLDNVLLDLYKRCGRIDDQIELLEYKLKFIEEGQAFGGRRTKIARSQGKKFHVSVDQEKSRLLGNLAWAYIQKENYQSAEALYRKALSIEPDKNKQCNLAICLMKTGRIVEARILLHQIRPSSMEKNATDSYLKSYERATEILAEIESQSVPNTKKEGEAMKTDIRISSASSIDGILNGNQNHEKERIKTEIQQSPSTSSPIKILSTSAFVHPCVNGWTDGKKEPAEIPKFSSPVTKGGLNLPASVCGDMNHGAQLLGSGGNRWGSGSDEELFYSPVAVKANSYSPTSFNGNQRHGGARLLGHGGRWGSDSEKDLFFTPVSVKGNSNLCTSVNGMRNHGAQLLGRGNIWGNYGDEEEHLFSDENLNRSFILNKETCLGKIEVEENFADDNLNGNKQTNFPTLTDVLSVGQSGDEENFTGENSDSNILTGIPTIKWKTSVGSPAPTQINLKHRSRWRRPDGTCNNSIGQTWEDWKKPAYVVDKLNTIEMPVAARKSCTMASQKPRVSLLASVNGNSNNLSEMSATESWKWADYADEKWEVKVDNLNSSRLASPFDNRHSKAESPGNSKVRIQGASSRRWADMVEEDEGIQTDSPILDGQWLKVYSKDSDDLRTSITVNTKMTQVPLVFNDGKKTWADTVEGAETSEASDSDLNALVDEKLQKLSVAFRRTSGEWSEESWDHGDAYPDENFNTNIIGSTPPHRHVQSPYYTGYSQQRKLETDDLKGPPGTSSINSDAVDHKKGLDNSTPFSTGFERNPSTRRSLSFGKQEPVADCTSPLLKIVDISNSGYLQPTGSGSNFGVDAKPKKRGNRLRIFQEITLPDSPRA